MKATEVRIGNLFSNAGLIRPVEAYDLNHWDSIAKEPILLSDEWYFRLGFFEDDELGWVFDSPLGFSLSKGKGDVWYYLGDMESFWTDILIEIKYVHQLQNLYFALTGEELEIKEP